MPGLIVEVLALNALCAVAALALGEWVLRGAEAVVAAEPRPPSLTRLGTALLAGFGGWALVGTLLGAVGLFRWEAFAAVAVVCVVLARRQLAAYRRAGARFAAGARHASFLTLGCLAVALVVGVSRWLATLAPSEASDELAYHLPEAQTLAAGHWLRLTLGGGPEFWLSTRIYGNLPTLMETLFGEALSIQGVSLAHALHLSILVSFVLLAAGVVRELWGSRPAALAVLGIALFPEVLHDATTAYVDAAGTSFETGAVLLFVLWAIRRRPGDAAAGALLLGFALGVKYTALATAGLAAVLVAAVLARRREWRLPIGLAAIALLACGYWYAKNLVRFGNPVFPFVFAHPGVSDATYSDFVASVHAFGPRTIKAFLEIPTRYANGYTATAFLGFALAPLALFARGPRRAAALLLVYVVAYTTYWFWIESHQSRFLMSAVIVAIILGAVAIGAARGPAMLAAAVVLAVGAAGVAQHIHPWSTNPRTTVATWLDTEKARYALGLESRSSYLHRYYGCQVDAVDLLATRRLRGVVGLWDYDPPPNYPVHNVLEPISVDAATPAGVRDQLRARNVRFALAQGRSIATLSGNPAAQPILAAARPIWHEGDCTLYRLNLTG